MSYTCDYVWGGGLLIDGEPILAIRISKLIPKNVIQNEKALYGLRSSVLLRWNLVILNLMSNESNVIYTKQSQSR